MYAYVYCHSLFAGLGQAGIQGKSKRTRFDTVGVCTYVQWNLRNKTTIQAMQSGLIFEVVLILQSSNTCVHGFGAKPKWSYFSGGRFIEVVI